MQFSLSIFFIIGILVITRQMNYIRTINLGYDKDFLVVVETSGELQKNIQVIKNELLENPAILNATVSMMSLVDWESAVTDRHLSWTGKSGEYSFMMGQNFVDYDFLDTLKLQMAQGRFFSREFLSDPKEACVVNEAAVKAMRMDEPLGKKFYINAGTDSERSKTIIGVVKDFNTQSLHKEIRPFWWEFTNSGSYLCLKLKGRSTSASLKFIENKIKEFVPDDPFSYYFLDDKLNSLYRTEQLTGSLTRYITFLAVFISCLGLFGLASFSVERRTKEIGIRKVLGSSSSQVVLLLTKEFTKWVLMANVLAWPAAYFAVNQWLKNFAFKTAISVWMFLLAAGLSLLIALITVSLQSIRAATANPANSLRYE
jgi:putative ABC transport system permease protein